MMVHRIAGHEISVEIQVKKFPAPSYISTPQIPNTREGFRVCLAPGRPIAGYMPRGKAEALRDAVDKALEYVALEIGLVDRHHTPEQ